MQWIGASCVAKIPTCDELFIPCDRIKPKFVSYNDHLAEVTKQVSEEMAGQDQSELLIAEIEKESMKRVKRDRC